MINIANIKTILIIRFSSLGDVVLTTALIRQIKLKFPKARIDFVTSKQFFDVIKYNPYLANKYEYDKKWSFKEIFEFKNKIKKNLNENTYDVIVDLQNNLRSNLFTIGLGKKIFKLKKNRLEKILLVKYKIKPKKITQIPLRYFETVKELMINDDGLGLEIWDSNIELIKQKNDNQNTITIAPGAKHFTKRYPKEKYIELINKLYERGKSKFILIGGIADVDICNSIKNNTNVPIENYAGKLSILESSEKISEASLIISNDSAIMHIASALEVPVIAIFGGTTQDLGFSPFRNKNIIIEKELDCRPCSHIGRNNCPMGHFDCMNLIRAEEIEFAINSLIKSP